MKTNKPGLPFLHDQSCHTPLPFQKKIPHPNLQGRHQGGGVPSENKKIIKRKLIQPGLPFLHDQSCIPLFQVLSIPEHLEKATFPRKLSTLAKTARFDSFCCGTLNFCRRDLGLLSLESSSIQLSIDHTTRSGTLLFSPLELAEAIYKYRI